MCSKTKCRSCGKATWQGCGMHVSCALAGIPIEQRCMNWKQGVYKPCNNSTNTKEPNSALASDWAGQQQQQSTGVMGYYLSKLGFASAAPTSK